MWPSWFYKPFLILNISSACAKTYDYTTECTWFSVDRSVVLWSRARQSGEGSLHWEPGQNVQQLHAPSHRWPHHQLLRGPHHFSFGPQWSWKDHHHVGHTNYSICLTHNNPDSLIIYICIKLFFYQVNLDGHVPSLMWDSHHLRQRHPHRHGQHSSVSGHVPSTQHPLSAVCDSINLWEKVAIVS